MRPERSSWAEWLEVIPQDQRDEVANTLLKMPVETYTDLNAAIKYLLAETIRGTVHPEVMTLAIRVLEFAAVTVSARHALDGSAAGGMSNLVHALKEARRELPRLEARFTADHPVAGQVIDVLPAKRA